MCQSWMKPDESFIFKLLKKILLAQNTIICNKLLQCFLGISLDYILLLCFKSFVPYKTTGWGGKKLYLLLALILTIILSLVTIILCFNCSFEGNPSVKEYLLQKQWE